MKTKIIAVICSTVLMFGYSQKKVQVNLLLAEKSAFDTIVDKKNVTLYTLKNNNGMVMQVTNYGARVVKLFVQDKIGKYVDVVLGYNSIIPYLGDKGERFLGATIGRYGNRIAKGRFTLDGVEYKLATNNNGQSLHGGTKGFDRVVWHVDSVSSNEIHFSYLSPDGEEGYPGNLNVKMIYKLTNDNRFEIKYFASSDKATPVNLTHHSFFNLKGEGNETINNHILTINADQFTPVDSVLIPLGANQNVESTPFDFRKPTAIGKRVNDANAQLAMGKGYDHNFVLSRKTNNQLELAASVYEPERGIKMEVWTTEPGLQFYGGNFFDGSIIGKTGKKYEFRGSFAIETQHFPDSPNQPQFPTTILLPNQKYYQVCQYKFSSK